MFVTVRVPLTQWTPSMLGRCISVTAVSFVVALAVSIDPVWGQEAKPATAPAAATKPAEAATNGSAAATYVGSDTCEGCHDEIAQSFAKSAHRVIGKNSITKKWEGQACESCHGPGSKHAESTSPDDIMVPNKLGAVAADKVCLTCHSNQDLHVQQIGSAHAKNDISCVQCHSVHKGAEALRPRVIADLNALCAKCHVTPTASFTQPYGHRITQNAMSCVDCHNPHGSILPAALQTVMANDAVCVKCHNNLRGPFVYQHAPVKLGGCMTCHVPHGSTNPKMLTRGQVRFVCQECHANVPAGIAVTKPPNILGGIPPSFHNTTLPLFQNCTVCHVKIHGSNLDRNLQR